ncbi:Arc family DNA-binding protein (plasmid) [Pseudomonas corrugata]|uniref:Arc family DNA-binding protein n=1 Tax=Pseudomonas corrugata TaxID=47879 RepID=UPI003D81B36B
MHPLAQEALAGSTNRQEIKAPRGVTVSRDADKFIIRLPPGMRDELEARGVLDGQSMNSVAVEAIKNHLAMREEQQIVLQALVLLKQQLQEALEKVQGT